MELTVEGQRQREEKRGNIAGRFSVWEGGDEHVGKGAY